MTRYSNVIACDVLHNICNHKALTLFKQKEFREELRVISQAYIFSRSPRPINLLCCDLCHEMKAASLNSKFQ